MAHRPFRYLRPLVALAAGALLIGAVGPDEEWDGRPAARTPAQFQSIMLVGHNMARATVGAPPLDWDPALARDAAAYARELAASDTFDHADQSGATEVQGENLWMGTRDAFPYHRMIGDWVAERTMFVNRAVPAISTTGSFEDVGHYSQVIWRRTTHVGCAMVAGDQDDYVVCRYRTAGNVMGERAI